MNPSVAIMKAVQFLFSMDLAKRKKTLTCKLSMSIVGMKRGFFQEYFSKMVPGSL